MYNAVNQYACYVDFYVFKRQRNPFNLSLWWHSLGLYVCTTHVYDFAVFTVKAIFLGFTSY